MFGKVLGINQTKNTGKICEEGNRSWLTLMQDLKIKLLMEIRTGNEEPKIFESLH